MIEENLETIIFTPLPFGTGNDLSRSLGWGKSEGKWAANLTTLVTALVKGEEDRLAIWQVDANAEVYGFDSKKMVIRSTTDKKFTKLMCCYFNLGFDADVANGKLHFINESYQHLSKEGQVIDGSTTSGTPT